MNAPTPPLAAEKSHPMESDVEAEISKLIEREIPNKNKAPEVENKAPEVENNKVPQIENNVARLSSSSVNDLQGLMSELQQLLDFLKSEVGRVESEIESVLAGIKIIIETIAPWKNAEDSPPPKSARARNGRIVG